VDDEDDGGHGRRMEDEVCGALKGLLPCHNPSHTPHILLKGRKEEEEGEGGGMNPLRNRIQVLPFCSPLSRLSLRGIRNEREMRRGL